VWRDFAVVENTESASDVGPAGLGSTSVIQRRLGRFAIMIGRNASISLTICLFITTAGARADTAKPGVAPAATPAAKTPTAPAATTPIAVEEPRDVVAAIYKLTVADLKKKPDGASPFFDRASRKKFFSKAFDALITTSEEAAARDKAAMIDFDPITASQDPEVQKVTLKTDVLELGKATVSASFVNRGQATVVSYDFIKQDGDWRVDDIKGTTEKEAWSVRKILKQTGTPPKALPGQKDAGKTAPDASTPIKSAPAKAPAPGTPSAPASASSVEKPSPKPN
jgi:hypothetical protein